MVNADPRTEAGLAPLRVVVVGAGIAGLTAALEACVRLPGASVLVLEQSSSVGGKLRLGEVAGQPVDLGAEAMLNRRPEATDLARRVGLGAELVYPRTTTAGIWTRGAIRPLPPSVMGVPSVIDRLAGSGIVSARGMARVRADRVLPPVEVGDDLSIGSLVARRLGPEIRDRLVEPLLGGVYAGRSDELSLRATVPQLARALEQAPRLLEAAASLAPAPGAQPAEPVFAGIRGGVGRLAGAVAAAVTAAGGEVRTGTTVRELARTPAGGFRLTIGPTNASEQIDADAVVLAVPAAPAGRLLGPVSRLAAAELAQIAYASMAIVTLAFDARSVEGELVGSGFLVPPVDGREVKASTFSSRKWEWLSDDLLVVRCSIGRIGEEAALQRDDADLVGVAVLDLRQATGLRATLVGAEVTRWGGALPQYAVGHLDRVERVRAAVAEVPGLAVCGAAYDGLGIPACIASAQRAVTQLVADLASRERMPR